VKTTTVQGRHAERHNKLAGCTAELKQGLRISSVEEQPNEFTRDAGAESSKDE